MRRLASLSRSPLLHFAVLGSLIFGLTRWGSSGSEDSGLPLREPVTITTDQVERAVSKFRAQYGSPPTRMQRRALVAKLVEEEVLYREALYLGLDQGDPSVAWRLLHKYRLMADRPERTAEQLLEEAREFGLHENDVVVRRILAERMRRLLERDPKATVSDAEINAFLARSKEDFTQPETVSFFHVYLGEDEAARERAGTALSTLGSGRPDRERVEAVSRPFPIGLKVKAQPHARLFGRFGQGFADKLFTLEPGSWHGPIESVYGYHLVHVIDQRPERRKSAEDLQMLALREISLRRSAQRFQTSLDFLRTLYRVQVEGEQDNVSASGNTGRGTSS